MRRALALAALLLPAAAAAFDFKGVSLGASEADVKAVFPWVACANAKNTALADRICRSQTCAPMADSYDREKACRYRLPGHSQQSTIASVPADISFHFYGDVLASIFITIAPRYFDEVTAAMRAKYGPPKNERAQTVQNRMGATFENHILEWENAAGEIIQAERFSNRITQSSIAYQSREALEEYARRKSANAKKTADDL